MVLYNRRGASNERPKLWSRTEAAASKTEIHKKTRPLKGSVFLESFFAALCKSALKDGRLDFLVLEIWNQVGSRRKKHPSLRMRPKDHPWPLHIVRSCIYAIEHA